MGCPIIPSKELGGIPLGVSLEEMEQSLSKYLVDAEKCLYQFFGGPILTMIKWFDHNQDGRFGFSVYYRDLTNWRLFFPFPEHAGIDPRALNIMFRLGRVY